MTPSEGSGGGEATWAVHSEWLPLPRQGAGDRLVVQFEDQVAAEGSALRTACCSGARYISVEGPGAVVTLEWDRYTNRVHRYPLIVI